jgi:hypothetical protein
MLPKKIKPREIRRGQELEKEETTGETPQTWVGQEFLLEKIPKGQATKAKRDTWDHNEPQSFAQQGSNQWGEKTTHRLRQNICRLSIQQGLRSRIYKELKKLNSKK